MTDLHKYTMRHAKSYVERITAVELVLDAGKLFVNVGPGKYWQCRRNGQTKLWKTRPDDFRIPIKFGFRGTGAVDQNNAWSWGVFRVAESREEAESGHDRYGDRVANG